MLILFSMIRLRLYHSLYDEVDKEGSCLEFNRKSVKLSVSLEEGKNQSAIFILNVLICLYKSFTYL